MKKQGIKKICKFIMFVAAVEIFGKVGALQLGTITTGQALYGCIIGFYFLTLAFLVHRGLS